MKNTNLNMKFKVAFAGICGSDINKLLMDTEKCIEPASLGHEIVCKTTSSSNVDKYYVVNPFVCACEDEQICDQSSIIYCRLAERIGCEDGLGAFSGIVRTPINNLHDISFCKHPEVGVFADGVAVIVHMVHTCVIPDDSHVLIIGDGSLGVLAAMYISTINKNLIVDIVIRRDEKRKIFKEVFSDNVNIISMEDIKQLTYDIIIEAVGGNQTSTLKMSVDAIKYSGSLIVLGAFSEKMSEWGNLREVFYKQLSVRGINSFCTPFRDFDLAVKWVIKNESLLVNLITDKYSFHGNEISSENIRSKILQPKTVKGCFYYE